MGGGESRVVEARVRLAASLERYDRWLDERRKRYERRRHLLNRMSFGLPRADKP